MSKATKRERQKENRERARIERDRLVKRDRQMKTLRGFAILAVVFVVGVLIINALSSSSDDSTSQPAAAKVCSVAKPVAAPTRTFTEQPTMTIDKNAKYTAVVCTTEGPITLRLDAKNAPIATNNFVSLAGGGFYDGLTFHRAAKGFVIQGGDPKGDGSGGPGYTVTGEVPTNHYPIGALAAAKGGSDPAGTFGSQFFIVTGSQGATLPNDYSRFGNVTAGLKNAQKIESFAPAAGDGVPTKKVTITKVVILVDGKVIPSASPPTTAAATPSTAAAPATSSTTAAAASTTSSKP